MAKTNRQPTRATFGNNAYDLTFYGDVIAEESSQQVIRPAIRTREEVEVTERPHERTRKKVQVREQQAVAPFAVLGFLAAMAIAIVLLLGYVQLNSVYGETVKLQSQLTQLQDEASNLEARYEEVFDQATLENAIVHDSTLINPTNQQSVYIDLSEPDNAVLYTEGHASGIAGFFQELGDLLGTAVEFFR